MPFDHAAPDDIADFIHRKQEQWERVATAFVTDANGPTYNSTVAGGGEVGIRVTSDGANRKT